MAQEFLQAELHSIVPSFAFVDQGIRHIIAALDVEGGEGVGIVGIDGYVVEPLII